MAKKCDMSNEQVMVNALLDSIRKMREQMAQEDPRLAEFNKFITAYQDLPYIDRDQDAMKNGARLMGAVLQMVGLPYDIVATGMALTITVLYNAGYVAGSRAGEED